MSMIKKAVIDRFEGKQAVLLVDEKPRNVLRETLPKGATEGDWLEVEFEGETLMRAKLDADETARMKKRIDEKLERLRNRGKG
jgi:AMMECR1 domain-containing protein